MKVEKEMKYEAPMVEVMEVEVEMGSRQALLTHRNRVKVSDNRVYRIENLN